MHTHICEEQRIAVPSCGSRDCTRVIWLNNKCRCYWVTPKVPFPLLFFKKKLKRNKAIISKINCNNNSWELVHFFQSLFSAHSYWGGVWENHLLLTSGKFFLSSRLKAILYVWYKVFCFSFFLSFPPVTITVWLYRVPFLQELHVTQMYMNSVHRLVWWAGPELGSHPSQTASSES